MSGAPSLLATGCRQVGRIYLTVRGGSFLLRTRLRQARVVRGFSPGYLSNCEQTCWTPKDSLASVECRGASAQVCGTDQDRKPPIYVRPVASKNKDKHGTPDGAMTGGRVRSCFRGSWLRRTGICAAKSWFATLHKPLSGIVLRRWPRGRFVWTIEYLGIKSRRG
jgi:hypothetical protein